MCFIGYYTLLVGYCQSWFVNWKEKRKWLRRSYVRALTHQAKPKDLVQTKSNWSNKLRPLMLSIRSCTLEPTAIIAADGKLTADMHVYSAPMLRYVHMCHECLLGLPFTSIEARTVDKFKPFFPILFRFPGTSSFQLGLNRCAQSKLFVNR